MKIQTAYFQLELSPVAITIFVTAILIIVNF
ncbi:MAG: hypothetical protein FOGNACKC_01866 [Anaerolineae bacterium]|nr:hypothetical protein [Anaerolineae bacterium]